MTLKFSSTLFFMFLSGNCRSLFMNVTMYSHMGEFSKRNTYRPLSYCACSVSTFSTTWLPKEHTLVEQLMVIGSLLSKLLKAQFFKHYFQLFEYLIQFFFCSVPSRDFFSSFLWHFSRISNRTQKNKLGIENYC
jgi:hypothetical protein